MSVEYSASYKAKKAYYERNKEKVLAGQKEYYKRNKQKITDNQAVRRSETKLKAIDYLGGNCKRCNGLFPPAVYDFHHRDPSEKEYNPANLMSYSWEKLAAELDKCDLLCSNCHRITHHELGLNDF